MGTHVVQLGETPAQIARKYTGTSSRMGELIAANPQKGLARPQGLAGPTTFDSLHVGEKLNLPSSWGLGQNPPPAPPGSCPPNMAYDSATETCVVSGVWNPLDSVTPGIPSWNGFGRICGLLAYVVYRDPSTGEIIAMSGGAITNPNGSEVPRQYWIWDGATPTDPSQLPAPAGLVCPPPRPSPPPHPLPPPPLPPGRLRV